MDVVVAVVGWAVVQVKIFVGDVKVIVVVVGVVVDVVVVVVVGQPR